MSTTTYLELEISALSPIQRLLLTTDGTITEMLEAAALEPVGVRIIDQNVRPADRYFDLLHLQSGNPLLRRKVLLRGTRTGRTYIHAESLIAIDRLEATVHRDLLISTRPIGVLLKEHRVEVFKEVLYRGTEPAGHIASFFAIRQDDPLLVRTCRIFSGGTPVMLITEHLSLEQIGTSTED